MQWMAPSLSPPRVTSAHLPSRIAARFRAPALPGGCSAIAAPPFRRGVAGRTLEPVRSDFTSVVCALGFDGNDDSSRAVPYQAKILWKEAGGGTIGCAGG